MTVPLARRVGPRLEADPSRVVASLFVAGVEVVGGSGSRASSVIERILALDEAVVQRRLAELQARFGARHRDLLAGFAQHAARIGDQVDPDADVSDERWLLLGAAFTHEYSVEAAALCNPSMIAHPDQSGVPDGGLRFVLSVRGIGEGHRSSIGFRVGAIVGGEVEVEPATPYVTGATRVLDPDRPGAYAATFPDRSELSERVLEPATPLESHGLEDARFVRFVDDDGAATHLATYTAYDGSEVGQHLLRTDDFTSFAMSPMTGHAAANKGLALFPRKVGGRYAALSRHDRETNAVAFSESIDHWGDARTIQVSGTDWDVVQLGNCGSPIETAEGWLVLTHGVGAMRTYAIGALLLDLDDPTRVRARLEAPLLEPMPDEQDGYVPNVVYSCGALLHGDVLVVPYGIADQAIGFATVDWPSLRAAMR